MFPCCQIQKMGEPVESSLLLFPVFQLIMDRDASSLGLFFFIAQICPSLISFFLHELSQMNRTIAELHRWKQMLPSSTLAPHLSDKFCTCRKINSASRVADMVEARAALSNHRPCRKWIRGGLWPCLQAALTLL